MRHAIAEWNTRGYLVIALLLEALIVSRCTTLHAPQ
jgi:hypothetical protein